MPRYAANLTMLYTEVPFLDRYALAAEDGFEAVEFLFPTPGPPQRSAAASTTTVLSWSCTTCRPATGTPASAASPATRTGSRNSAPASTAPSSTPRRWA